VTEISFYFNAPDKVDYACRLLRKAFNAGAKVMVVAEPQALAQLDAALWTFSPVDFIPHCFGDANAGMLAVTPVVLASSAQVAANGLGGQILLNLGGQVPEGFERFERLMELVGAEIEDRLLGRVRWKHYAHRGYALTKHDLTTPVVAV
jgi:DNA polymerase III subunit chi